MRGSDSVSPKEGVADREQTRTSRSLLRCDDRDFHDHGRLDHLFGRGQHGRVGVYDKSESLLQVA